MLRFGTDGVRGRAFTELTTTYAERLGRAAASVLGGGDWLIGRDTRESGPALQQAFASGLRAGGASPRSVGVAPTPALAHLSAERRVPAAMITASHNPWHDNGIKIFAAGGTKLPDDVERAIEAALDRLDDDLDRERDVPGGVGAAPVGVVDELGCDTYVAALVARFPDAALSGLRIVLDGANGAMSVVAPQVARALGADVVVIHADPDGRNINDRCGATAPETLAARVVAEGAALGLAFDGDGDRVIAVDHRGRIVDGDRLIGLAARQLRESGELVDDTVVVTVMTNLGFRRAMADAGIRVLETAVGDRYVLEALDAGGYALGGEQSGHIIYRRLATTGDGLLAGLRLAEHVVHRGRPLAELADAVMTSYPQVLVNVTVAERHPRIADELAAEIAAAEAGLAGEGRILVRASGTEPLVRVMVEAATSELAQATADGLAQVVRDRFGVRTGDLEGILREP
ncbi:MAG: phosphoglucosamine mutase [Acidimicrobiales bacterium]|nr:phosphoglucosamine mutase [Acidimicrobiales bacterium]MCB9392409.1 phosphoglucosamine mutase [Acidimicrobiaceae bacterium]